MDFTLFENERAPGITYFNGPDHWYSNIFFDEWWSVAIWFIYGWGSIVFIYLSTMFPAFFVKSTREEFLAPIRNVLKWAGTTGSILAVFRAGSLLLKQWL